MKDWMIRAIKTFIQAFFGVAIPEIVVMLQTTGFNFESNVLLPLVAAALAAGISAAWNIVNEKLTEK